MVQERLRRSARRSLRSLSRPIHPLLGSMMRAETDDRVAALTFDDGPDEFHTPRIVEVLSRHGLNATFFMLARRATDLPDVVNLVKASGHEIALHGEDHTPLIGRSSVGKLRHIKSGKRRLEATVGERIRFFRPPYGWQDVRSFLAARVSGLTVVGWSAEGDDWLDLEPAEVADRVTHRLSPGAIVLLHDRVEPLPYRPSDTPGARLDRAQVVEELVARASSVGLRLVSLGDMLRAGRPDVQPWFWRPVGAEATLLREAMSK